MAGGDPTESTESRLGAFVSGLNRSDREFVRDLLTELDAPASYVGAADPATEVERKRRELRAAIAEIFAEFYGGADSPSHRANVFARDWYEYATRAWPRERDLPALPPGERKLRAAFHRISRLSGGRALSASQIRWILGQPGPQ